MIRVEWTKCVGGDWCPLETVNLTDVKTDGVYVIWHSGNPSRVVRVGQGGIKDRLCAHRLDKDILGYRQFGTLRVTWAAVAVSLRDGVERFLAEHYKPLAGDRHPMVAPIAVNLPGA